MPLQSTQRLDEDALADAPEGEWKDKVSDSVNLLNDAVSNQSRQAGVSLVDGHQVEVVKIKVDVPDPYKKVADADFLNGWSNNSSSFPAKYVKHENGMVEIWGIIGSGSIGDTAFILPPPYRPATGFHYAVNGDGAFGMVIIGDDGAVAPTAGTTTAVDLHVTYSALDSTPVILKCWPKQVQTKFTKLAGVFVANVEDSSSDGKRDPGSARSVSWQLSTTGEKSIKVTNIQGLPYNRTSLVTLVLVGG